MLDLDRSVATGQNRAEPCRTQLGRHEREQRELLPGVHLAQHRVAIESVDQPDGFIEIQVCRAHIPVAVDHTPLADPFREPVLKRLCERRQRDCSRRGPAPEHPRARGDLGRKAGGEAERLDGRERRLPMHRAQPRCNPIHVRKTHGPDGKRLIEKGRRPQPLHPDQPFDRGRLVREAALC